MSTPLPCPANSSALRTYPPSLWRLAMVVLSALIMCSCSLPAGSRQGMLSGPAMQSPPMSAPYADGAASLAPMAPANYGQPLASLPTPSGQVVLTSYAEPVACDPVTGEPLPGNTLPGGGMIPGNGMPGGPIVDGRPPLPPYPNFPIAPMPYTSMSNVMPDGLECPWPQDEYIRDGGDAALPAHANADWQIFGLDVEDTVGHFDTLDGRVIVKPSNRVYIYAPRFAAVRGVSAVVQDQVAQGPVGYDQPVGPVVQAELRVPTTTLQRLQPYADVGRRQPGVYLTGQGSDELSKTLLPHQFVNRFLPFEDLAVIRTGVYEQREKALLAEGVDAAITWTRDQAVQVHIDGRAASETVGDQRAQATFMADTPGLPCLRVIKVASKLEARPGELIEFTIRFDNVGEQVIGNVTIVDNLSPRLEYVEHSAQSSVKADFVPEENEVGSLVLRWEINDPLEPDRRLYPGHIPQTGGIVRFQCRVR